MSFLNPSIRSKNGERVALSDCKLEPLNLLIPGGAPVLVPKHKAWPGQKKRGNIRIEVPLAAGDSYDAEEENDLEERPAARPKKPRKASQAVTKHPDRSGRNAKGRCGDGTGRLATADTEGRNRKRLEQRTKEQEGYIAGLKARYAAYKAEAKTRDGDETETETETETGSDASSGAEATDGSRKVRDMLSGLRIRAAGNDADGFTPSEDAQILARKEGGESFRTIAGFMKRTRKQVARRYEELVRAGKTAETVGTDGDGEGVATDAATVGDGTGSEKTDGKTGGENDAQVAEGDFGGLFDLGKLTTALEAVVAAQDSTEDKAEEPEDDKNDKEQKRRKKRKASPPEKTKASSKKGKDQEQDRAGTSAGGNPKGGASGYESGSEATPGDAGALLYINQYAGRLLRDRDRIPEADERFDEDDCVLLALAESHHRRDRWEQIQARFANLTGRMVPLEVLRYKLGEGEKPEDY